MDTAGQATSPGHWDSIYQGRPRESLSWYQEAPRVSLELIEALKVGRDASVIDVGGGTSSLPDLLADAGFSSVTVLDISASALAAGEQRLAKIPSIHWLHEDVLTWQPAAQFDLWHDRALFHFLVEAEDRARYLQVLLSALRPGGAVILATFAHDAPEQCSGLPVVRYEADDLCSTLGSGFRCLEIRREEHITPGGALQPFTWVAARFIAGAESRWGRR